MTSLTYQTAVEANPVLREQLGRALSQMRAETKTASFAKRFWNFWASLYATPMPAPRHYL